MTRSPLRLSVTGITVPVTQLGIYLIAGVLLGAAAATGPAIRAGRLDLLDALRPTG